MKDQVYIGDNYDKPFMLPFGCARRETKHFYTQQVDGILGLSRKESPHTKQNGHTAIYKQMKKAGIIDKLMFTLCLGQNGGYLQFGGYSKQGFTKPLSWINFTEHADFKIPITGIYLGNTLINTSIKSGLVDSGTSYAYFPRILSK